MLEDRQAFKQHVGAPPPSRVQKVTLGDNLKGASILRECGLASSSSSSSSSQKDIQRQTLQLIDSIPKRAKGVRVRPCAIALEPLQFQMPSASRKEVFEACHKSSHNRERSPSADKVFSVRDLLVSLARPIAPCSPPVVSAPISHDSACRRKKGRADHHGHRRQKAPSQVPEYPDPSPPKLCNTI